MRSMALPSNKTLSKNIAHPYGPFSLFLRWVPHPKESYNLKREIYGDALEMFSKEKNFQLEKIDLLFNKNEKCTKTNIIQLI